MAANGLGLLGRLRSGELKTLSEVISTAALWDVGFSQFGIYHSRVV